MKHFLLIFSMIFLFACSEKSDLKFREIYIKDLYNFIVYTNNITSTIPGHMSDSSYAIPSEKWIKQIYIPQFQNFLNDNNVQPFLDNANDCDKFVSYGLASGNISYNRSSNRINDAGLAMGEYGYYWEIYGHDVIFFVAYDNYNQLVLIFFDPQSQKIVNVSPTNSFCIFWKM